MITNRLCGKNNHIVDNFSWPVCKCSREACNFSKMASQQAHFDSFFWVFTLIREEVCSIHFFLSFEIGWTGWECNLFSEVWLSLSFCFLTSFDCTYNLIPGQGAEGEILKYLLILNHWEEGQREVGKREDRKNPADGTAWRKNRKTTSNRHWCRIHLIQAEEGADEVYFCEWLWWSHHQFCQKTQRIVWQDPHEIQRQAEEGRTQGMTSSFQELLMAEDLDTSRKLKLSCNQVCLSVLFTEACSDFVLVSLPYLVFWVSNHFFTVLTDRALKDRPGCKTVLVFY